MLFLFPINMWLGYGASRFAYTVKIPKYITYQELTRTRQLIVLVNTFHLWCTCVFASNFTFKHFCHIYRNLLTTSDSELSYTGPSINFQGSVMVGVLVFFVVVILTQKISVNCQKINNLNQQLSKRNFTEI